jgi:hypothetical protein
VLYQAYLEAGNKYFGNIVLTLTIQRLIRISDRDTMAKSARASRWLLT